MTEPEGGPVRVPLVDVRRHNAPLHQALEEAFQRVLERGQFVLCEETEAF